MRVENVTGRNVVILIWKHHLFEYIQLQHSTLQFVLGLYTTGPLQHFTIQQTSEYTKQFISLSISFSTGFRTRIFILVLILRNNDIKRKLTPVTKRHGLLIIKVSNSREARPTRCCLHFTLRPRKAVGSRSAMCRFVANLGARGGVWVGVRIQISLRMGGAC